MQMEDASSYIREVIWKESTNKCFEGNSRLIIWLVLEIVMLTTSQLWYSQIIVKLLIGTFIRLLLDQQMNLTKLLHNCVKKAIDLLTLLRLDFLLW